MNVVCEHCGLPFSVPRAAPGKAVYCCSGCALAARISVDGQGAPLNTALVSALGAGFVFFNQSLFWMLAVLLSRRAGAEDALHSGRIALASLILGVIVWLALMLIQWKAGAMRATDRGVLGAGGFVLGWAFFCARPEFALLANLLLAVWTLRGLARKKVSGKKKREQAAGS